MENDKKTFDPLNAVGIFWMFFGILVLIGIFFSTSNLGRLMNGICGMILALTGLFAFMRGFRNRKRKPAD
ncbi:MAG: hypothetical protein JW913_10545 [Chitinispirillaceae bacterium]|nr:hypothetical protein [Chitinispirillaceae bacterium]